MATSKSSETARAARPKAAAPAVAPAALLPSRTRLVQYKDYRKVLRTLSDLGGPFDEPVVATSIAEEAIGKLLAGGWNMLACKPLPFTSQGIPFMWTFGEPEDTKDWDALTGIRFWTRTIAAGAAAIPPHVTARGAAAEMVEMGENGWFLWEDAPLALDSGGLVSVSIWVK